MNELVGWTVIEKRIREDITFSSNVYDTAIKVLLIAYVSHNNKVDIKQKLTVKF